MWEDIIAYAWVIGPCTEPFYPYREMVSFCLKCACGCASGLLFTENKWARFDVIYYEYGAVVLIYHTASKARNVLRIAGSAQFDDKQLLVLTLPHLEVRLCAKYHNSCCGV